LATPGWPHDCQTPLRTEVLHEVLGIRFPPEEEGSLGLVKHGEPLIGAYQRLWEGHAGPPAPGRMATNPCHQPLERLGILEPVTKVDPSQAREKPGQSPLPRQHGPGEQDRNDAKPCASNPVIESTIHLLILPRTYAIRTDKHRACPRDIQRLLQRLLPGI